jgi:hypothetical protein
MASKMSFTISDGARILVQSGQNKKIKKINYDGNQIFFIKQEFTSKFIKSTSTQAKIDFL